MNVILSEAKDLSISIQAGGQSRRMGRDKGLVPFLGQPLIARIVDRLRPLAGELIVTTNQPEDYAFLQLPLFADLVPDRGALGGLYTAIGSASLPFVAVIACDMPFINADLLQAQYRALLTSQSDICILNTGEGLEPFHAIYRRESCLPHIRLAIDGGSWRVDTWYDKVKLTSFSLEDIRRIDPDLRSFWNVNTPAELSQAEQLAKEI